MNMNSNYSTGPARASTDITMYANNNNSQGHKQSMNDSYQNQVTKDNLLGNMLASHNQ